MASKEAQELAAAYKSFGVVAASLAPQQAFRPLTDHMVISLGREPTDVTYAEELNCPGSSGNALWCKPTTSDDKGCVLYFHGGGFMSGSPLSHRKLVGHLAKHCGVKVLLTDYRLAPENAYPAQLDDGIASYKWLLKQGFSKIAIAGDSAGGCLALITTLKAAASGIPPPSAVICFSPWCDMEITGASLVSNADKDYLISKDNSALARDGWLQGTSPTEPLANPLYGDFSGFPPLFISVGSAEVLLSDSETLAERAKAAGVTVELEIVSDAQHVHVYQGGYSPEANESLAKAGAFYRRYQA